MYVLSIVLQKDVGFWIGAEGWRMPSGAITVLSAAT